MRRLTSREKHRRHRILFPVRRAVQGWVFAHAEALSSQLKFSEMILAEVVEANPELKEDAEELLNPLRERIKELK